MTNPAATLRPKMPVTTSQETDLETEPAAPRPARARPGTSFWAGWPTRTRLMLTVLAIDVVAALVSCGAIVVNARNAVRVEMEASLATVEPLVADTLRSLRSPSPDSVLHTLDLRFQSLRHVRVTILDAGGQRVGFTPADRDRDVHDVPGWFVALIAPEPHQHDLPILVRGETIGTATISTEPLDEIEEVWGYARTLALASLVLNLTVLAALFLAFGRILKPLGGLADGLTRLERHDYTAHLDPPASRELAVIAARFNRVAEALGEARAANGRLNRQLLTAQDDERRRTALELHDEFGPCLFALEANSSSIARIAATLEEPARARLTQRTDDIAAIVKRVQTINRALLNRLRPAGLGQAPLSRCLELLVREGARHHPEVRVEGRFAPLRRGYGDLVDLTVYRCIQEGLTNALRHAGPGRVAVEVAEDDGTLHLSVEDDGRGLGEDRGEGRGLAGVRERVEALGGRLALVPLRPGTALRIALPAGPETPEGEPA